MMIEKMKLGAWEYFVYMMSGVLVVLIVMLHAFDPATLWGLKQIPAAVATVISVLALLIIGMLLEPISNITFKIVRHGGGLTKKSRIALRNQLGFKSWDVSIENLEKRAGVLVSPAIDGNVFQFAKAWVLTHGRGEEFYAFLSKFGFYRSVSLIFGVNAVASLCLYDFLVHGWWLALSNILLCLLYYHRSGTFYRHMSVTVFNQFIQGYSGANTIPGE
jgi:hypothetical protein